MSRPQCRPTASIHDAKRDGEDHLGAVRSSQRAGAIDKPAPVTPSPTARQSILHLCVRYSDVMEITQGIAYPARFGRPWVRRGRQVTVPP